MDLKQYYVEYSDGRTDEVIAEDIFEAVEVAHDIRIHEEDITVTKVEQHMLPPRRLKTSVNFFG